MKQVQTKLVVTRDDYKILNSFLNGVSDRTAFDPKNAEELKAELKKAEIVTMDNFPDDVVRINSRVTIKADDKDEIMELILVTPEKANIKEKKISVLAPVGTALIGLRKGQKINWKVPAGNKAFTILEVNNHAD